MGNALNMCCNDQQVKDSKDLEVEVRPKPIIEMSRKNSFQLEKNGPEFESSFSKRLTHDQIKKDLEEYSKVKDSIEFSTKDNSMSSEQKAKYILSFKDFKGLKYVDNIKDRYKIGRVLGEGSFGQVRIALHRQAEIKCAIKIIRKEQVNSHKILQDLMRNELKILEDTSHPNIMRIYELLQDDKFYFIVSEFIRYGELYDFIIQRSQSTAGSLTESEVKQVAKQLFYVLNYMHEKDIVHRDIKPENILLEDFQSLSIKLTDFGFAQYFNQKEQLSEVLGSPIYMPPEIVNRQKYNSKVDIWSAGVVLYIMLCGRPPFIGTNKEEVYRAIQKNEINLDSQEWLSISSYAKDFIYKCLIKDPNQRVAAWQLLAHRWLRNTESVQVQQDEQLVNATQNLKKFCTTTSFQKTIISIIAGLRIQQEELRNLKDLFISLDKDQNGFLSVDELQEGLQNTCMFEMFQNHHQSRELDFQLLFDQCDIDHDGKLNYSEFIQASIDYQSLLNQQNIKIAFSIFDQDKDGRISLKELRQVFTQSMQFGSKKSDEQLVKSIMLEVDKNQDNFISYQEFNDAITNILIKTVDLKPSK